MEETERGGCEQKRMKMSVRFTDEVQEGRNYVPVDLSESLFASCSTSGMVRRDGVSVDAIVCEMRDGSRVTDRTRCESE